MEFKLKEIDIPASDPYQYDQLDRKEEVENIAYLLKNISSPIVFSINAPWGSGKSTFVRMLHQQLLNCNAKSIYFNAWQTDFAKDPLLAFLGEMNNALNEYIQEDKSKRESWDKAKKLGTHIIKKSFPVLVKLGTSGLLDIKEENITNLIEGFSKDIISDYWKDKSAIVSFKENLSNIFSENDGSNDKLFIFIDELDRCRPTYSIELLERIKHFLDIKGLVFILSLDKEQLSHSIKSLYGSGFEAIGYLRRFFDIEYTLARPGYDKFIFHIFQYYNFSKFFKNRLQYSELRNDENDLLKTFQFLCSVKKMTLREIEQLFAKVNLVILSTKENVFLHPILLLFLLFVKEYYPTIYLNYIDASNSSEEVVQLLYSLVGEEKIYDSFECAAIEARLIIGKLSQVNNDIEKSLLIHKKTIEDMNKQPEQREYSKHIYDICVHFDRGTRISLSSLVKRIEMLDQFILS